MKKNRSILVLIVAGLLPFAVHAGTPLICHPYSIGNAKSLPAGDWKGVNPNYDRSRLVEDTLALLTSEIPILVRMETLRRATIYATGNLRGWSGGSYTNDDRLIARALLEKLRERTQQATDATKDVALFDLGFFAETLRQTNLDPALDGYAILAKVAGHRPDDPDIQFALALASSYPERKPAYASHLARAKEGAQPGTLLAANVISHLSGR